MKSNHWTAFAFELPGGFVTLVDASDLRLMHGRRWHVVKCGGGKLYVVANDCFAGKAVRVHLHRLLLGVVGKRRPIVDHIDGDTLNNRRSNLRLVTHAQNNQNCRLRIPGKFRGVFKDGDAYRARAGRRYLGRFKDPVKAALAHDAAAIEIYGPGAATNFGGNP